MNMYRFQNLINYLSLVFVLSFFILHNIILVLIGIALALININQDSFALITKLKYRKEGIDNILKQINFRKKEKSKYSFETKLVETIEELGYIPSIDNTVPDNKA